MLCDAKPPVSKKTPQAAFSALMILCSNGAAVKRLHTGMGKAVKSPELSKRLANETPWIGNAEILCAPVARNQRAGAPPVFVIVMARWAEGGYSFATPKPTRRSPCV